MNHMTQADWDEYIQVMNEWQEDMFQQTITWVRHLVNVDIDGEGDNQREVPVELKCLVQYNYFRSWPITKPTGLGELDEQSVLVFFNNKYLSDLGYIDSDGQFNFNPSHDRFLLKGIEYKARGDSHAAQAHDNPLFTFMVLTREESNTGEDNYG